MCPVDDEYFVTEEVISLLPMRVVVVDEDFPQERRKQNTYHVGAPLVVKLSLGHHVTMPTVGPAHMERGPIHTSIEPVKPRKKLSMETVIDEPDYAVAPRPQNKPLGTVTHGEAEPIPQIRAVKP